MNYGNSMSRRSQLAASAFFLVTLVSCSGEKGPEFAPVQGVVRINGKPEPGLLVRLSPDGDKGNGLPAFASGKTDDQGKYTLNYEYKGKEGVGAPVGWHRVTLADSKVGFTPQGQMPKPSAVPYAYSVATTPLIVEV